MPTPTTAPAQYRMQHESGRRRRTPCPNCPRTGNSVHDRIGRRQLYPVPRANQQGPSRRKRGLLRATKHRWPNTSLVIDQRRAPFFSACVGMVLVKAQLYVCWHEVGLQLLCYVHAKDCKLCPPPLPDLVLVLGLVSPGAACRLRESGRSSFCIIAIMKS
jgi:hypothetical protein